MGELPRENITWHVPQLARDDRERLMGHPGGVLWFTGLSGSGKSTVANLVDRGLHDANRHTYLLDGDNVRFGLNSNLGFSPEDRAENIRRIGEVARLFVDAGLIVLAAVISPYARDRAAARARVPEGRFVEVFVDTDLSVCEARDPKGLYKKARAGEIRGFTGIDDPYERPSHPEVHLAAGTQSPEALANQVIEHLRSLGWL